jgi:aspartate kinase (monofunctional class)
MTKPVVLKFGGTSVGDADALERVAGIVRAHGGARPVLVVSALSGVTDALVKAVDVAVAGDPGAALRSLDGEIERHRAIARRLLATAATQTFEGELERARGALAEMLADIARDPANRAAHQDAVVATGELLSAALVTAVLGARGHETRNVDARGCITTDETPGRATPDMAETVRRTREALLPLLENGAVPVLGGFIAASRRGATTTLGRGGSDYSAALVGAALDASEIQIWTDTSGVLTADPRIVPAARTVPRLSYAEAAELAYFGAKVLHPRTIAPALDRGIPVRICNSHAADGPGTLVTAEADIWPETVKAIAFKKGIAVVRVTAPRTRSAHGFLRALFEVLDRHRTSVDVVSTSEVSVSLTVEKTDALPLLLDDLRPLGHVEVEHGRCLVSVVGEGLRRTPGIAARVFETIKDINIPLVSQGASSVNLTFVVDESHVAETVVRLHAALFETEGGGKADSVPIAAVAVRPRAGTLPDPNALARRLIDIPSVSGDESSIARFLAAYLGDLGYRVELLDALPGRPNLLATTGAPPRVVLSTHLDTVPPFIGSHEDGDYIYGRGACDSKGILAAQIVAAERLRAEEVAEIGLLFVVDEEMGSLGARAANAHPRARECRYVIVGEPTDNKLAVGCKGSLRISLRTEGSGGHSAYPERGTSAIDRLLDVLADVRRVSWPGDAFFGETTCNIGVINGGTRTNVLATDARADLHFRVVTDADAVQAQLERVVAGRAEIERLSVTPPVRLLGVSGFEQCVVGFTTDTAHLGHWGTPLLLGPGSIHDAHTDHERIAKQDLSTGVELYTRLVRALQQAEIAGDRPAPSAVGARG